MNKYEKCKKCQYFGKPDDAEIDEDCMWEVLREEGTSCVPPCEEVDNMNN